MKRIKLYEDFNGVDSIIQNLEDICLELNDKGIRTECKYHRETPYHRLMRLEYKPKASTSSGREHISVGLEEDLYSDDYKEEMVFGKIQDVVLRILDYMKSCDWKPSFVIFDGESYHIEKNTEGAIQWLLKNFKSDSVLSGLTINFIRDETD